MRKRLNALILFKISEGVFQDPIPILPQEIAWVTQQKSVLDLFPASNENPHIFSGQSGSRKSLVLDELDFTKPNEFALTPLFIAAAYGDIDTIRGLIANGSQERYSYIPLKILEGFAQADCLDKQTKERVSDIIEFYKYHVNKTHVLQPDPMVSLLPHEMLWLIKGTEAVDDLFSGTDWLDLRKVTVKEFIKKPAVIIDPSDPLSPCFIRSKNLDPLTFNWLKKEIEQKGFQVNQQDSDRDSTSYTFRLAKEKIPDESLQKIMNEFRNISQKYLKKLEKDLYAYRQEREWPNKGTYIFNEPDSSKTLVHLTWQKFKIVQKAIDKLNAPLESYPDRLRACQQHLTDNISTLSQRRDSWLAASVKIATTLGTILIYRWLMGDKLTEGATNATRFAEKYKKLVHPESKPDPEYEQIKSPR